MGLSMANIVELVATITGKIDGFRKAMFDGAAATEGFSKAWTKAGADVANAATNVGASIGLLVGGVVAYTAKMGMAFNSMKEDALADFTVMLQSATKAKEMLADIQEFAAKTPLETTDITLAAKTLLNFGVAGDQIMPMLKRLGDASGGNAERFKQMALAYGQISSTGRLMGTDLLQLINAGFNPLQQISARTGESMLDLKKRMESGGIAIEEVDRAFIDATSEGGRFFGLMEAKSQTATGLMSTMADNIKISAGRMFEPLSAAFKRTLQTLTGASDGQQATQFIESMRLEIRRISNELERMLSSNGTGAVRAIGDAFLWAARGTGELIKYLRQSGPEIVRQTQQWMQFLAPVGQWIAKNPGLVAGIVAAAVAFKGLQILGVVSAFTSLIGTIGPTIALLTKIPAAFMAIQGTVVAASGPMLAFFMTPAGIGILAALVLVAAAFAKVRSEAAAANAEADRLDKKFSSREDKERKKALNFKGETDEDTLAHLKAQRDIAEKQRLGLAAQERGANKAGSGEDDRTKAQISQRLGATEDFIAALDEKIADIGSKAGENMAKEAKKELASPQAGGAGLSSKEQAKLDKQTAKDVAKRQDTADDKVSQFQEKLRDLQGTVPTEELQAFAGVFTELRRQFLEGEIDADQYRDSLRFLDNRMRDASQIGQQQGGLADHTQSAADRLDSHEFGKGSRAGVSESVIGEANKKFDAIEAAGQQVANAFKNGQISATQYANEIQRLKKATDDVTEAAIKEEQQKRREALLKGDFKGAGLDFNASVQQKIQDKLADQKMAEFDNAVDNIVNQFVPLATIVQTATDGFTALDNGLAKAADSVGNMGGGGSGGGGNDGQAMQNWVNYLTSQQGKVDSLFNNISFLQQALTVVTDPTRIKELTDSIANLNRQIAAINNQVHTFTGHVSNDPIFRDPGITGGGGHTSVTINNHIPNVYNFTQSEIDHLSNSIANSLGRQGHPAFS